ncbi:hypothetical protein [Devosia sp. SD17-2]|uniref:hypothetical protein n=1 Tax=Devosia sp. SD17-2 TaxID=2976459 RepID=UPI0023D813EF|nr:hypothetical protein [Devosia sp. SD17-2]WEJ33859.1 hypothetical protein NYQ88_03330 [Devosia sp. SD17-2]
MTEVARAEAFAKQADRSREIAEGLVRQGQGFLNKTRAAQELVSEYLRKHGVQHQWDDTKLSILSPDGTYGESVDLRGLTGDVGPAPVIETGTIATSDPGSEAEASITGEDGHYLLHLVLPRGEEGPVGPPDGNTLLNGEAGPASGLGKVGDFYLNTSNWDIYGPKTAGGWGEPASLSANIDFEELEETLTGKLDKAGGTMTGPLVLAGDPEEDDEAAPKGYVDAQTAGFAKAEVGSVVYAADPPAAGYLPADGAAYLRMDYPELAACFPDPVLPAVATTILTAADPIVGMGTNGAGTWIFVTKNATTHVHTIHRSTDDGLTFASTPAVSNLTGVNITCKSIAAEGDDWIIGFLNAGVSPNVVTFIRSSNNGASWSFSTLSTAVATALHVLAANDGVFYAGVQGTEYLLKSEDGGASWTPIFVSASMVQVNLIDFHGGGMLVRGGNSSVSWYLQPDPDSAFGLAPGGMSGSGVGGFLQNGDILHTNYEAGLGITNFVLIKSGQKRILNRHSLSINRLYRFGAASILGVSSSTYGASNDTASSWEMRGGSKSFSNHGFGGGTLLIGNSDRSVERIVLDPEVFKVPDIPYQGPLKAYIYAGEAA